MAPPVDFVTMLLQQGGLGLVAAGGVSWAIFESRKTERLAKEHDTAMEAERQKAKTERDRHAEELRRAQADILRLATEFAQARALQVQTDKLHTATMAEVMATLTMMGK